MFFSPYYCILTTSKVNKYKNFLSETFYKKTYFDDSKQIEDKNYYSLNKKR
jgi:hypothetical protein